MPTPKPRAPKKSPVPTRLRSLADDAEERARVSSNEVACLLYRQAARSARLAASAGHLTSDQLRVALEAQTAIIDLARWHDGEGEKPSFVRHDVRSSAFESLNSTNFSASPADDVSVSTLNARQLAALFAMNERTARRAIERGVRSGLHGFYRDGWQWLAEPEAFKRARQVSELCPNASPGLSDTHDGTHNASPPQEPRPQADRRAA